MSLRLAYIISAYKLPEQLVRLVRRLYQESATFLIHVDRKTSPEIFARMHEPLASLPNVRFLPRHICYWGDFGHVQATLKGIRTLVEQDTDFDYAFLLTGQDYPLRPPEEIAAFLEAARGREFLQHYPLPAPHWGDSDGGLRRFQYWHFRPAGKLLRFPEPLETQFPGRNGPALRLLSSLFWSPLCRLFPGKRRIPGGLTPYGGSSYWCLSRECLEYIYRFTGANPGFVRFFRSVDIPDELFFQTIVLNSPLRQRVVNEDLRLILWPGPRVLLRSDFPTLRASEKLFARKFDGTVDAEILDLLDTCLQRGMA